MGFKRETWCHFGKAWCHFVWFYWTACLPFYFIFFVLFCLGVCQRMFAVFFAFILEDCVLPVSVCHPTQPTKMYFLKYSIFVLTPRSLPYLHPFRPPIRQRAAFAKTVIHALKRVQTNDPRPQKLSTPASSLKSPPTSYPPCRRLRRQIPHRWSRVLGVAQDPVSG